MNPEDRISQIVAEAAEIEERLGELVESEDGFDQATFDELEARLVELAEEKTRLERVVSARAKAAELADTPGWAVHSGTPNREEIAPSHRSDVTDLDEIRSIGFGDPFVAARELRARAVTMAETVRGLSDRQRQQLTDFIDGLDPVDQEEAQANTRALRHILTVANPEYTRMFTRWLKSGLKGVSDPEAAGFLARAMSLTDSAGGYAVPLPIDPTIVVNDDGTVNPFREICTVKQTAADVYRSVNMTAVTGSWDGEAAEVSDDTPTVGNVDITPYKAQVFVPFSLEIGDDFPDLLGTLGELIAIEKDDMEAAAFAVGTGTNQPVGIVTALAGGSYEVPSNTTDTFALADVYDLEEELPAKFRRRAVWVANKRIYQATREAGGANLDDFWANLGQGQPPQLLGYPAYEASEMDGVINATAENRVLVFGDFRNYWIVDRIGLSVELIPHLFATANNRPSGQRGLYAWFRVGGDSVNDRAFRLLNVT